MKKITLSLLLLLSLAVTATDQTNKKQVTMDNTLFKNMLGNWDIKDWSLGQDGKWQAGPGADWNWSLILDGHAIQDDWISPALGTPTAKTPRQFGTNIRIYNPKAQRWEMAWMSSNGKKLDTFFATETDSEVVMTGFYAGAESKITFFNITEQSFDWKLEQQQKDGTWIEVYRIKGKKKPKN